MKLALLGDVHGNHRALRSVLDAASSHGVEALLITGDLVGYYDAPLAVIEMLKPWKCYVVRGNHEDMLKVARMDAHFLNEVDARYGPGLRATLEQLSEQQLDELCNLPHPLELEIDGCRILLCHGAPWDNNQYVYPDAKQELLERCALQQYDLIVLGHSHYPMNHRIGKVLIVNPSSVGQPRNRQPGAQWAIFDTISRNVKFINEEYNYTALAQECKHKHPQLPYLADVLIRT